MKKYLLSIVLILITSLYSQKYANSNDIKLAVLKYGTVNWELNVIKHHNLDEKYGINIDITYLTNKNASAIALMSDAVDMIVTDWIWVSRQRDKGENFSLIPYSTAAGAIMVPEDSSIDSINDIQNVQIGIAGGSIDKSWILIRAYTIKKLGYDIAKNIEPAYAAPPLINGMITRGELDGALNYWNYTARLKALNFKNIISVTDVLPYLGIGETLPLIGYVFREEWAKNNPESIKSFMSASNEARKILDSSEKEWNRIQKITGAKNLETLNALKEGFRKGIPSEDTNEYIKPIKNAFKILANLGGKDLVGDSKELANGVIWIQK
tara:strand:+ start:689 stop:1660 length:972 start_codon:yes stop_codon:yes gene_type:complete